MYRERGRTVGILDRMELRHLYHRVGFYVRGRDVKGHHFNPEHRLSPVHKSCVAWNPTSDVPGRVSARHRTDETTGPFESPSTGVVFPTVH